MPMDTELLIWRKTAPLTCVLCTQDWNDGVIPHYTMPPAQRRANSLRVVSDWGKEFSADKVMVTYNSFTSFIQHLSCAVNMLNCCESCVF